MKTKIITLFFILTSSFSYSQKYDIKYYMECVFYLISTNDNHNPKIGYLNSKGKVVVDTLYANGLDFRNGIANVVKDGVYGYINLKNELKLFPQFHKAYWDDNTGIAINKNKKYALINSDGHFITDYVYSNIKKTSNQYYFVEINGKGNFINLKGEIVFDKKLDIIDKGIYNSVAAYKSDDGKKLGLIKIDGSIISDPIYDVIYGNLQTPYWTVSKDNKFGILNGDGSVLIPIEYDKIDYTVLENSFIPVMLNKKYGYIDKSNKLIIPYEYDKALPFIEGFAIVKKDGIYGYITEKNDKIAFFGKEPFWNGERYFNDGLAAFKINGKCGFINKKGKVVIEAIYDDVENFQNGIVKVTLNELNGYINTKGKIVIPIRYSILSGLNDDRILFQL